MEVHIIRIFNSQAYQQVREDINHCIAPERRLFDTLHNLSRILRSFTSLHGESSCRNNRTFNLDCLSLLIFQSQLLSLSICPLKARYVTHHVHPLTFGSVLVIGLFAVVKHFHKLNELYVVSTAFFVLVVVVVVVVVVVAVLSITYLPHCSFAFTTADYAILKQYTPHNF